MGDVKRSPDVRKGSARSNSLIIPRPCSLFGDRDNTSNTSELLGQQDYEVLTYTAPPEPHLDRCTLKVR